MAIEELSELLLQRRRKVDTMWEAGVNPYPNDFKPQHTSADLFAAYGGSETIEEDPPNFVVAGRIIARRSFGKAAFVQLQDRKGRFQLYVKKDAVGDEAQTRSTGTPSVAAMFRLISSRLNASLGRSAITVTSHDQGCRCCSATSPTIWARRSRPAIPAIPGSVSEK